MSKSVFPESANNNEIARHHYYLGECPAHSLFVDCCIDECIDVLAGRIKAIQLEYSEAYTHLVQVEPPSPTVLDEVLFFVVDVHARSSTNML